MLQISFLKINLSENGPHQSKNPRLNFHTIPFTMTPLLKEKINVLKPISTSVNQTVKITRLSNQALKQNTLEIFTEIKTLKNKICREYGNLPRCTEEDCTRALARDRRFSFTATGHRRGPM